MKKIISIIFVMTLLLINKNIVVKADSNYDSSLTCDKTTIAVGETTTCRVYIEKTDGTISSIDGTLYIEDSILEISNESVQHFYKDSESKYLNESDGTSFILTFDVKGIAEENNALIGFGVIDDNPYIGVNDDRIDELLTTISVTASESNSESSNNNESSSESNASNNNSDSSNETNTLENNTTDEQSISEEITDKEQTEEIKQNDNNTAEEDIKNPQTGIEKPYLYALITLVGASTLLVLLKKKHLLSR